MTFLRYLVRPAPEKCKVQLAELRWLKSPHIQQARVEYLKIVKNGLTLAKKHSKTNV